MRFFKLFALLVSVLFLFSSPAVIKDAEARCCLCCPQGVLTGYHSATRAAVNGAVNMMFTMLTDSLLTDVWWSAGIRPLVLQMANELTAGGWMVVAAVGAQIDGRVLQETKLAIQVLQGKAASRHTPSVSMCKFASLNQSLAQSDMRSNMIHSVLNEYSMRRTLGQRETAAAQGPEADLESRLILALNQHCDPQDFGGEMSFVCGAGTGQNGFTNKDISYTNMIDIPRTINIAFDDAVTIPNDQNELTNVIAMKQLLYNHEVAPRANKKDLTNNQQGAQSKYMHWRSIQAKRSVAENSFDNLVGMKAASGSAVGQSYVNQIMSLGIDAATAAQMAKAAPSYWAQMEALTKNIYQNPEFYANLYDNPANVDRQSASMEAISLMQMRDYYESLIRSEMALAVMLDNKVSKEQDVYNINLKQWGY